MRYLALALTLALAASAAPAAPADTPLLFATSDRCLACHNGLTSPSGEDVSFGSSWQPSMMANAARDPYWRAAVRRETIDHPGAAAAIEHECATCHMPMARFRAHREGRKQAVLTHDPATPASHLDRLAADGVSCSACHQITPNGLGEEASFTGGFVVDGERAWGARQVLGPYEVTPGLARVMRSAAGFEPAAADHVESSEVCATCHTLITHALGPNGEVVGELPEQVPYLEWKHSAYPGERECVSCHMPDVDEPVAIASVLGEPREGVSRHVFRGGNVLLPLILANHRDELGVVASRDQLEEASRRTREHLASGSAELAIERLHEGDSELAFDVLATSRAGHKLPTAYPSRRVWLHVIVRDADGRTAFESGALRENGAIEGNDNDAATSRFEPHYTEITRPDEVQIYEAILAGPDGAVTTGLLTASRYLKDNRLLPRGFDRHTAEPRVAVHGRAGEDPDFLGGSDRVGYRIGTAGFAAPFTVEVELIYQPVGYRWADNLRGHDTMETDRFVRYWDEVAGESSAVLARAAAGSR